MSKFLNSIPDNVETKREMIDFSFIEPNPYNKEIYDKSEIDILRLSIEAEGLRQPLEVVRKGVNDYYIISGHRRYEAMKEIRIELPDFKQKVECIVYSNISQRKEWELIITGNAQREKKPIEIVREIKKLKQIFEENESSFGNKFFSSYLKAILEQYDFSKRQGIKYKKIADNLIEEWLRKLEVDEITLSAAYRLAQMEKKEQSNLYNKSLQKKAEENQNIFKNGVKQKNQVKLITEEEIEKYAKALKELETAKNKVIDNLNKEIKKLKETDELHEKEVRIKELEDKVREYEDKKQVEIPDYIEQKVKVEKYMHLYVQARIDQEDYKKIIKKEIESIENEEIRQELENEFINLTEKQNKYKYQNLLNDLLNWILQGKHPSTPYFIRFFRFNQH